MDPLSPFALIIGAIFVNNVVLAQFLGICPFLGVSKDVKSSLGMGGAVLFVMLLATLVTYLIYKYLLLPFDLVYLQTIAYILVIAGHRHWIHPCTGHLCRHPRADGTYGCAEGNERCAHRPCHSRHPCNGIYGLWRHRSHPVIFTSNLLKTDCFST